MSLKHIHYCTLNLYILLFINFFISIIIFYNPNLYSNNHKYFDKDIYKSERFLGTALTSMSSYLKFIRKDINKNNTAKVRIGENLSDQEKNYIKYRKLYTKHCLEDFLNVKFNSSKKQPTIAVCTSGGGLRSMFASLGLLSGLEDINLLNGISYMSTLSGSTFALSSWLIHDCSLKFIKEYLLKQFEKSFIENFNASEATRAEIGRIFYGKKITPANIFGALLTNKLFYDFKESAYHLRLTDLTSIINKAKHPFPLLTALKIPRQEMPDYSWVEFNPYEVSYTHNNHDVHVPTWSFGRYFENGYSQDKVPECSLGFLLGICGSAFTVSLQELYISYRNRIPKAFHKFLKIIISQTPYGTLRIKPGVVNNPLFKHPQINDIYNNKYKEMFLVDAGIDFNLPLPPLLKKKRNIDCIIILDSSYTLNSAPELKKAEDYARRNGYNFPKINYNNIEKKTVSVFKNKDLTIIYIPLIKNPSHSDFDPKLYLNKHLSTFNLRYTQEQAEQVVSLVHNTVKHNALKIKDTIKSLI